LADAAKAKIEEQKKAASAAVDGALGDLGIPSPMELFAQMDVDGSGFVEMGEFRDICKYMGIAVSEENLVRIFAISDKKRRRKLDLQDFMYAQMRLRLLIAEEAMNKTGLSKKELIVAVIYSLVFLLMLFAFIFIGISAFSKASSFGSVVNSALPMSAGGANSGNGEEEEEGGDDEGLVNRLSEGVEKALEELKL
jgi:hypothetical protein